MTLWDTACREVCKGHCCYSPRHKLKLEQATYLRVPVLYKYLSKERINVVQNLAIRFSPLRSLNDPFESLPLLNIDEEIGDKLAEAELSLNEYWDNLDDKTDNAKLELDEAREQIMKITRETTDPQKIADVIIDNLSDRFGVLCVSRTNKNLLMWSHYTDNGKGYVIGFDEKHSFFNKTALDGTQTRPLPVIYSTERQPFSARDELYYEKMLCRKSIDWAYEEEERIFTSFAPSCDVVAVDDYGQDVILTDIPSEAIKAIYIGYNASKETRLTLETLACYKLNECTVYQARIDPAEYSVIFEQVMPQPIASL